MEYQKTNNNGCTACSQGTISCDPKHTYMIKDMTTVCIKQLPYTISIGSVLTVINHKYHNNNHSN